MTRHVNVWVHPRVLRFHFYASEMLRVPPRVNVSSHQIHELLFVLEGGVDVPIIVDHVDSRSLLLVGVHLMHGVHKSNPTKAYP
jgi:hypothetical protein